MVVSYYVTFILVFLDCNNFFIFIFHFYFILIFLSVISHLILVFYILHVISLTEMNKLIINAQS